MSDANSLADSDSLARAWRWVGTLTLAYAFLWLLGSNTEFGLSRYLPLHTTVETVAIIVAMLAFGIAWNAHAESRPGNVLIIGAALFGTALLDFGHTLSYQGMPEMVTPASPQKAIVFWLAARYLAAIGLLVVALRAWKPMIGAYARYWLLAGVIGYVAVVYQLALGHPESLPAFFVAGQGLTPLKVALEYGLVGIYGVAAWRFHRQARAGAGFNAADLFAAAAIAALSELCFTLYASVSDLFNMAGHVYKIVCYAFIYRAVFVDSVRQPFVELQAALAKERTLAQELNAFVRTLDLLDEAVLEIAPDGRILSANRGWWRLAGVEPKAGYYLPESIHDQDRRAFEMNLQGLASGDKDEFRGRLRFRTAGRPEAWVECRLVAERDAGGRLLNARGVLRDVTKGYLQERHIAHMAMHDALTNLPNRALLEDRIRKATELAQRSGHRVAVCFIDIDHFKNINDAYGHKAGDLLLQTLAGVIKKVLREGDTLARWGGDEFVVLLPELEGADGVRPIAQALIETMRQTFEIEGVALNATFSVGISLYPDDAEGVDDLLAQADRAMFHAKSLGRNTFQLYSDMSNKGLGKKELYIQSRLAQAIRDERIGVWFQPLVAARPAADGSVAIAGFEALARWHDPDYGWVSPASFIPMAENLGLIGELGHLVRRQALAQFRRWLALRPDLHLAMNVSKRQLFAPDFVDALLADVEQHAVPPSALTLEVTESVALLDVEFAEERLQQIVAAGFRLSIDDFGTGYASLSQLHELPVSELKIDISFVRRVHTAEGARVVQAIVSLAQSLRLRTVAEGIEDEATAAAMRQLGADLLQGYHFGRPAPAEEIRV
ncbi:MASE3 domain-containing protein [Azospira restricta]|uniref:EAL domain-containing protein n=1 Tax=Azospira restricta TaxID=404405 RepID=A0A974PWU4_9RHOO|nr:MASE3 domain-containing protein [Azospira restricta]QRJ62937.1 EAL domain-containing protein [Azospira restricta]